MKPWVYTEEKKMSSNKERHYNVSICLTSWKCRPFGAQ